MSRVFSNCHWRFACAGLGIYIAAIPFSAAAQEKLITIGSTNPTGAAALAFVMAEKKGLFKKEGLNAAP